MGKLVPHTQHRWLMDLRGGGLNLGYLFYSLQDCCCISFMLVTFPPLFIKFLMLIKKIFSRAHKAPEMFKPFFCNFSLFQWFFLFPPYQAVGAESSRVQQAAEISVPTHEKAYAALNFWLFNPPTGTSSTCEVLKGLMDGNQSSEQPQAQIHNPWSGSAAAMIFVPPTPPWWVCAMGMCPVRSPWMAPASPFQSAPPVVAKFCPDKHLMSHELSWPYGLLSSAKIFLQAAASKVRGILVDAHSCGLADGVCSMLYTQTIWIKFPWSADLA